LDLIFCDFGKAWLVPANGILNDPYGFAHFHLSSQLNASTAVDLVTLS